MSYCDFAKKECTLLLYLKPAEIPQNAWTYVTFVYIFFAAVLPIWLFKQPRDTMTIYMFIGMIAGTALGLLVAHPAMNLPVLHLRLYRMKKIC